MRTDAQDRGVEQTLLDVYTDFNLPQVHNKPTEKIAH